MARTPATPPVTSASTPHLNKAALVVLIAALVSQLVSLVWYWAAADNEPGRPWAVLLLFLPTALILTGAVALLPIRQQSSWLTMAIGTFEVAKSLLLIVYVLNLTGARFRWLLPLSAWVAWLGGLVLVFLVFRLTSRIMRYTADGENQQAQKPSQQAQKPSDEIIEQLIQHRFLSISGLLVAFLQLTFLLAFAVAFHDMAEPGEQLKRLVPKPEMEEVSAGMSGALESTKAAGFSAGREIDKPSLPTSQTSEPASGELEKNGYVFAFREGSGSMQCTEFALSNPTVLDVLRKNHSKLKDLLTKTNPLPEECKKDVDQIIWNLRELHALGSKVMSLDQGIALKRYVFIVISRASEVPTGRAFASNYEISRARAEEVQVLIEWAFATTYSRLGMQGEPLGIDWRLLPAASVIRAPRFNDEAMKRFQATKLPAELIAELRIYSIPQPSPKKTTPFRLELLDYLYFMIYTITTTGYGDLMPTSAFVQFVASLANIFELFFMVIAFNVILTLRRPLLPMPKK